MGRRPLPPAPPADAYGLTLGELETKCRHRLWKGKASEIDSQRRLNMFVHLMGPDMLISRIRKEHLEDLQETLLAQSNGRGGTYSPATVNRIMVAGSKALAWAVDNEYLNRKPKFPLLEEDNEKNAWIREQDVPRFAQFVMEHQGWRYAVALMTLLVTGLRVGELLKLEPHQLEQEYNGLWFLRLKARQTKRKKPRSVPIPESLARPLMEMLTDGEGVPTYRQLWRTCKTASRYLGLPEGVTPHVLRHSAATLMTRKGVPTATVAKLLGHSSIKTTQRYDHWVPAHNPLDTYVGGPSEAEQLSYRMQNVPIDLPKTYPKDDLDPSQRAYIWGRFGHDVRTKRATGGLGGNRTPVQGFAVRPATHSITSNPLKSRDKQEE